MKVLIPLSFFGVCSSPVAVFSAFDVRRERMVVTDEVVRLKSFRKRLWSATLWIIVKPYYLLLHFNIDNFTLRIFYVFSYFS